MILENEKGEAPYQQVRRATGLPAILIGLLSAQDLISNQYGCPASAGLNYTRGGCQRMLGPGHDDSETMMSCGSRSGVQLAICLSSASIIY